MAFDPSNPFANSAAIPASVQGIQPKLGTPQPQVTVTPTVPPDGTSQFFAVSDQANILFSLAFVVGGIANNQFLTLNNTQITAIETVFNDWSATNPYGATLPGVVTIQQPDLQNTVVAMQAVNYLQTTGLLTTTQDLIDSNGQIQMVTGFAPNGASTLTIHNQKVLCAVPNTPFWYASNVGAASSWNPLSAGDMETYSDQPLAVDQCYAIRRSFRCTVNGVVPGYRRPAFPLRHYSRCRLSDWVARHLLSRPLYGEHCVSWTLQDRPDARLPDQWNRPANHHFYTRH